MKLRALLCLAFVPVICSCAATVDYFAYSYKPPGFGDPQATISFMANKAAGDFSLRYVGEDDCDMGGARLLSRSTSTEAIYAEKMVFFSHAFHSLRGNSVCTVEFAFVPRAKAVYEVAGEMARDYCMSKIFEVKDSERIPVATKKILYTTTGRTACRKMHAD